MNKKIISLFLASAFLGASLLPVITLSLKGNDDTKAALLATVSTSVADKVISQNVKPTTPATVQTSNMQQEQQTSKAVGDVQVVQAPVQSSKKASKVPLSRGGPLPNTQSVQATSKLESSNSAKPPVKKNTVELLDWWKEARYVFSIGTVAEVKDLYTGKTFKVKRTMGTNHADTEALTKADTAVIKSIWGGFSWDRRPVILTINGRRLAASTSAMPHAGLDSAPAYAIVNNRSEGYGRGENLDVIKGNGMDGHFDIHFLNSTRHKDGKEDPAHQAAVLIAAGK